MSDNKEKTDELAKAFAEAEEVLETDFDKIDVGREQQSGPTHNYIYHI